MLVPVKSDTQGREEGQRAGCEVGSKGRGRRQAGVGWFKDAVPAVRSQGAEALRKSRTIEPRGTPIDIRDHGSIHF